jgi:predicted DNA binding CopG/RHH family protein
MRKSYDFSKGIKNPYIKKLKKPITIRIDNDTLSYFKNLAMESDIPYQKLINHFLRDCAVQHKRPSIKWVARAPRTHMTKKS